MRFFSTKYILTALCILAMHLNSAAQDSWAKERAAAVSKADTASIMADIAFLSGSECGGRATGTEGSARAAGLIAQSFQDAGLVRLGDTWEHEFSVRPGLKGRNIIGMLPGAYTLPCDSYIVVGAHYDHIGMLNGKIYPGADYNASGTAVVNALAEMFGSMRKMGRIFGSNIIFVAFDASEHGLKGSESLWNMIEYGRLRNPVSGETVTKDKITLMVNIDQIGSSLAPVTKGRDGYMIMLGTQSLKKDKRNLLAECNRSCGTDLEICLDYYGSANFTKVFYRLSDQRPFVDNKIPAVLFTSGITMNNNKTWDTPETLNPEILRKRTVLIFNWLEKMIPQR